MECAAGGKGRNDVHKHTKQGKQPSKDLKRTQQQEHENHAIKADCEEKFHGSTIPHPFTPASLGYA